MSLYLPYQGSKHLPYLKVKRLANRVAGWFGGLPNVVFVNLQNSGSSAMDPILREILAKRWYYITPFGPEGSQYIDQVPYEPLYHWSHSSTQTFNSFLGRSDCKFIYLHRDLRDVSVSWAHDMLHNNIVPGKNLEELIEIAYRGNLRAPCVEALRWINSKSLIIRFDEIKADTASTARRIFDYIGIDDLSEGEINAVVDKYSFERIAGRKRGEEGAIVRSGYMHRKGISGEWRNHFDREMIQEFKDLYGEALVRLGYESDAHWA